MSQYGVEIIANNGNSFIIPDNSPFTFHHRWEINVSSDTVRFKTDIPDHVNALFFIHYQLNSQNEHPLGFFGCHYYRSDGYWWILTGIGNTAFYGTLSVVSFTDAELKDVSGGSGYGIQIFDDKGNLVYGNKTKPLKILIQPGPPIRPVDGFIGERPMDAKYAVMLSGWCIQTHRGGTNIGRCYPSTFANGSVVLGGFLTGIGINMTPNESWIYYNASNVMCIRLDDYQN